MAFWLQLENAYWAGTTAALVCQPQLGASLRKGWYRMTGTLVGAVAIVMLTACFPQQRAAFLVGLALWCAACALVSTLLRNFAAYSAALAGYTAAIIASDQLGATGGLNGDAFMLIAQEDLDAALAALAQGDIEDATRRFALVDRDLASASEEGLSAADALQARASILAMSDAFSEHASYFGAGART